MSAVVTPLGLAPGLPRDLPAGVSGVAVEAGLVLLHAPARRGAARAARLEMLVRLAAILPALLPVTGPPAALPALRARLAQEAAALRPALAHVRGRAELLVTLEDRAPPAREGAAPRNGRDWLAHRHACQTAQRARAERLAGLLIPPPQGLDAGIADHRLIPFALPGGRAGADLALLVPRGAAPALGARLESRVWPRDVAARVTGPWPCFSFAPPAGGEEAA